MQRTNRLINAFSGKRKAGPACDAPDPKPGITIARWLFAVWLVILLIVALLCRLPWKVPTLLFIVILALTVLPRRARKIFWAAAGLLVMALIIWILLPDNNKGWRPYIIEKQAAAFEANLDIPPEQNAAKIYDQLLEDYDPNAAPAFLDKETEAITL